MQSLLGNDYGLLSVELPNPPSVSTRRYEELFSAPVNASTPGAVLRVPSALLHHPVSGEIRPCSSWRCATSTSMFRRTDAGSLTTFARFSISRWRREPRR
ncbi:hypothetical protein ACFSSF_18215 [Dietzia aerolata]|uniref:hypothetical protein n=1 Tax=Dietzia aerolata TaxID=595984 RepID=UPI003629574E